MQRIDDGSARGWKMKILILANNDIGLYQFRKELIVKLLEAHEVYISLPYGELIDPLEKAGCCFVDTQIDRRGVNPVTDFKLLNQYFVMIRKINPDLVITYTIKPNIYGGLVSRILRRQYAVNITGLGTAFQKKGILRKFVVVMYKTALKKAKVVFFENSENRKIFVGERIVKKDKTCVLNGAGVNLDHYTLLPYPEEMGVTRFLFVGRVMKEKGIEELFTAMRKLQEDGISCTLDVVGEMEEDYKEQIEKFSAEGWLNYHGYQKDVRPFIQNCHCFVLPSWHEGMANTNLECAACGRPLITSDIPGCREAVTNGVSGYLCLSKDADSLYSVMERFMNLSSAERREMGIAGREHMEESFDKQMVVGETISKLIL